ncbi:MAG: hypothetical protein ACP5RH_11200 [Leptodesmis sp.]|uniref:hypothetical protein n=1 Tax=Leptodesmis sp. TaxID=3100501 RepID=UPI003D0FF648
MNIEMLLQEVKRVGTRLSQRLDEIEKNLSGSQGEKFLDADRQSQPSPFPSTHPNHPKG